MKIVLLRKKFAFGPLIILIGLMIVGCTSAPGEPELLIAAAASLTNPFSELGEEFTSETGVRLSFAFASTGQIAQQIRNGAPYDVFAAADLVHIDQLIDEGHLVRKSRTNFAVGSLVFIFNSEYSGSLDLADIDSESELIRLVIANPNHAPYGFAAKQYLENSGQWDAIQDKLVITENVRQAAQIVISGNATAGIVSKATVVSSQLSILAIDQNLIDPILHTIAISIKTLYPDESMMFLDFLASQAGIEILSKYGLIHPGAD